MSNGRQTRDGATVRRVQVMLDEATIERAKALGDGNLSQGIRQAIASLRTPTRQTERGMTAAQTTEEEMTIAETVVAQSYENGEMGYYARLSDRYLRSLGGRLVASSNDGESIVSFSPTDTWEFPDGSRAIIGYAVADVA